MDRLPSVGNGYVAPREAGPGRRSHTQGGADRTAWTRLSTVLLSDADANLTPLPPSDISQTRRPRHVPSQPGIGPRAVSNANAPRSVARTKRRNA